MPYQSFKAKAFDHYSTGSWYELEAKADVLPQEAVPSMCIKTDHELVYITRTQAKTFFGLVEPTKKAQS
jgi:hypothetical protein